MMRRTGALLLGLIACGGVSCTTLDRAETLPQLRSVEVELASRCSERSFSGVVKAVVDSKPVLDYRCDPERLGIGPNTNFKIFSTSKMITGAVIATLIDEGVISPGDRLGDLVREIPAAWSAVSVEELLTHTSGVPDLTLSLLEAYEKGAMGHTRAMEVALSQAANAGRVAAEPPRWSYNNFGYELLALIAVEQTGEPFHDLVEKRVFAPAKMRRATVELMVDSGEMRSRADPSLVPGYNGEPGMLEEARSSSFVQQGAGAVHASAEDLVSFAKAYTAGELFSRMLLRRAIDDAVAVNERVRYGYGFMVRESNGTPYLQHSGGTNGYVSDLSFTPDGEVIVVILSNFGFARVSEIRAEILDVLLD